MAKKAVKNVSFVFFVFFAILGTVQAQPFVHPGIDMNQEDLDYMKEQVLAGQEPWSGAFERLRTRTRLRTEIVPSTHIIRGPFGRPNIGGGELLRDANAAQNCALIWYITGDERYAQKALEIIEKWSVSAWSFDDNDAKLLAGMACYHLCSGAEILRYLYHGWTDEHTELFSSMLLESFYPVLRFYFPEANGNWDAVIARGLLSIAVFTDNRGLFDSVIDNLIRGTGNGSIIKYVYPSGQCQETLRSVSYAHMGLSEFAGAARIAYTQGVDLFSLGNNRLALGYEYAMDITFGGQPQSYGPFSVVNINSRRDDYEYVYQHYTAKGVKMPLTQRICEEIRNTVGRGVLTAFRAEFQKQEAVQPSIELRPSPIAYPAGATNQRSENIPANSIEVAPGESLQEALDKAAGTGRWVVAKAGVHRFNQTLNIPSGTRLTGEGLETVLMFESIRYHAVSTQDPSMHDVRISNLVIDGATTLEVPSDPNGGRFNRTGRFGNTMTGIAFLGQTPTSMRDIVLENVTVIHFSRNGVFIAGAENVEIINCNISDNGSRIVPGPRLQHNLLLRHVSNVRISDSRFSTSLAGCGIVLANCSDVIVERCEIARNAWFGILLSTSNNISITGCLIEGNCGSGIMAEYQRRGCRNINVNDNIIQYNNGYGVEVHAAENVNLNGNKYHLNGRLVEQEKISTEPQIILK